MWVREFGSIASNKNIFIVVRESLTPRTLLFKYDPKEDFTKYDTYTKWYTFASLQGSSTNLSWVVDLT